ncbi:MAG: efflux RND transporter periplasmic adaptor subunit [Pseudomonadota bacterium]
MREVFGILLMVTVALAVLEGAPNVAAEDSASKTDVLKSTTAQDKATPEAELGISRPGEINAVIYPFQSATMSTEVRGIVDLLKYQEGDAVKEGDVVAEVSKDRYTYIVGEFKGNYEAVCRALEQAREALGVQQGLYDRRAATYQDLLRAKSEVRILEERKFEAENKLKQAELNVKACVIRAPFSGIIGVLYREPYEAADNLEKIFELVDTHKVYARANWPEARLSEAAINGRAVFSREGKSYEGVIKRISKLIDPASRSKRIHVLIDNSDGRLEIGMSGSLKIVHGSRVSSVSGNEN